MSKDNSNNKFALWIAVRYLFSKKSHNAVNVISGISSVGIAVATMALVVVLSVFNGFDWLVQKMFSAFDPDLEISLVEGKRFEWNDELVSQIENVDGVVELSQIIEESALARYGDHQKPVTVMGVQKNYNSVTNLDEIMYDGVFSVNSNGVERATIGVGVASKLGINPQSIDPLILNAPKRTERINIVRPEASLITEMVKLSGVFVVNQPDYDDNIVMVSLPVARQLFEYDANSVTSVQLRVANSSDVDKVKKKIISILGDEFQVLNKYEQQKDYFKIASIEKWMTYLILSFILMIAILNIIGLLSLLIIEKKENITTLRSLGCSDSVIKRIFLFEGWLIAVLGAVVGLVLGVVIVLIQQHFGILKMGDGYVVDYYVVRLSATDLIVTFVTVVTISFFSVLYPVRYISDKLGE